MTRAAAIELILLGAWLGAAVTVAAVVAPAAFRVLPSRTLAGEVVGQVLPVIFIAGIVVAIVSVALEARSEPSFLRIAIAGPFAAMLVGCIVAQFIIGPRIEIVRASIGGAVDALAAADPRRVQFGRLHAFSVLWMGVAMLGAAAAIGRKLSG
jgi:vacuolar-type H+-ATPase subunit I/STV1